LGILRTVQWLIAMALALLACLAFLFALFLGAVALFNREVSAQMYHNLKTTLLSSLIPLTEKCCSTTNATQPSLQAEDADQQRYESLKAEVNTSQEHLETTKQVLTKAIDQLTTRIESLEAISADMAGKQQVEDIGHDVEATKDVLTGMQNTVSALQSTVDQNARQLQETSPDNILGDLPQRLKNLEEQQGAESPEPLDIKPLQDDINSIQAELNHVKEKADQALLELTTLTTNNNAIQQVAQEAAENTSGTAAHPAAQNKSSETAPEEHRIFSYFDNQTDKDKLAQLVRSTLDQDMSYKQVLNFLAKEFGTEKGKIISSHPSLSKDYIRQCRKNR
ncbi:MAG: hypothetical protein D3910_09545, partial [Candidatus Electrothrix sp. ATG2]|nr:hypothetical protein [Candidatus Electrothrix sp. ATG2]